MYSHTRTRNTVYSSSRRKNRRLLGFSSCLFSVQLPPLCFPSLFPCSVLPSLLSLASRVLHLSVSLFFPVFSHISVYRSLVLTHTFHNLTLCTYVVFGCCAHFFTDVTFWTTDCGRVIPECVQLQLLCEKMAQMLGHTGDGVRHRSHVTAITTVVSLFTGEKEGL